MYQIRDDLSPDDFPRERRTCRRGPAAKYPLGNLAIGQSFDEPFGEDDPRRVRTRLEAAVYRFRQHHPERRFSLRYDFEESCLRVFREKDREDRP